MTETELMAKYSNTVNDRIVWASEGRSATNRWLFHNRMSGCSDDGKRVIGKNHKELPGSMYGAETKSEVVLAAEIPDEALKRDDSDWSKLVKIKPSKTITPDETQGWEKI